MGEEYINIYDYLKKINKLDAKIYGNLLSIYGEFVVNKAIEELIDEDGKNAFKFEYYISQVISYDDMAVSTSNFECYGMDLNLIPTLSKEENEKLSNELFIIVTKLNQLINDICFDKIDLSKITWLSDKVKECVNICNDEKQLNEIKKLYNQFIDKRNVLVNGNLRLVISIAKKYYMNESMFNESIQYGNMGLMRAVEKYDPFYKANFATYAYYWVKQAITRNLHCVMHPFTIPAHQVSSYYRLKKVRRELYAKLNREPTLEELSLELNMSMENIVLILNSFNDAYSLYDSISNDDDTDGAVIDFIEDETASVTDMVFSSLLEDEIRNALSMLTDKERFVLENRFGFIDGKEKTLDEIGKMIGVTRERIRQIEAKSIRKLSRKCKSLASFYFN